MEELAARLGVDVDVVRELVERGERALSHRPVAREVFVARIAALPRVTVDTLYVEDLYIACALAAGDPVAVQRAEAELIPAAREAVGRIDRTPAFVDEVVQEVRLRVLLGAIAQYRGSGPLASWIRIVARRIAIDRKRVATPPIDDDGIDELPAPDDPELAVIWKSCAETYRTALGNAFAALDRRDRTLLRQRYVDGLNIDALGRVHGVNASTAFRWIKRIEQELLAAIRATLGTRFSDSQMQSMERLIADRLELSISGLIRAGSRRDRR